MAEEKYTSIRIQTSTVEQLKMMGRKGESYDEIILWLLKNSRKRKGPKISKEIREMRGLK
jgi:predicted CopG family antitoxin